MNKNVWLLFACQALMNAVMSGQTIMASLVGYRLSGTRAEHAADGDPDGRRHERLDRSRLCLPRLGRRGGFWLGCAIMMCGSLTFALGIYTGNFVIYCLGAIPAGFGFGISQHLRFAAAEVADPHAKARAISLVLAGGVVAAIVGPEMVKAHQRADPALHRSWPPICICRCCRSSRRILLSFVQVPPAQKTDRIPVPFRTIFARPDFVTAVISSLVGLRDDEPRDGLDPAANADVWLRRGRQRGRDPRPFDGDVPAGVRHRPADPEDSACIRSS